jgi:hypothetical protein
MHLQILFKLRGFLVSFAKTEMLGENCYEKNNRTSEFSN